MSKLSRLSLVWLLSVSPLAFAQSKSEPPVPVRTVAPDFPDNLKRDGVQGIVTVKCTVDEQGNVRDPTIEKSSNPAFEKPAVAAVKKWRFKPATQDGKPIAVQISIPIKFVNED